MTKDRKNEDEEKTEDSANTISTTPLLDWTVENENIMIEWCDVAQCYKWLNTRAHQKYSRKHAWFTIPAIVLSTITGTASFAQTSLPLQYQVYAPMVIGSINICIGILTTIQQYLKISELNESHRVAAIAWDKYARNIRIELAKSPLERMDCGHFLKHNRQEYDRLMETSPSIPMNVLAEFKKSLPGKEGTDQRKKFEILKKPDICDSISSARETLYDRNKDILKTSLDFSDTRSSDYIETKDRELYIYKRAEEIRKKEIAERQKEQHKAEVKATISKSFIEVANKVKSENKKMDDYVANFMVVYGRKPMADELENGLKDDIADELLKKYIAKYVLATDENV